MVHRGTGALSGLSAVRGPLWLALLLSILLFCAGCACGAKLKAVGVQQIPLLHSKHPPWIHPDHQNFSGPLGAYLDHLLQGCGFKDGFNITLWANTSRMAEFDVLTGASDIAFPVYRLWATAPTTLSEEAGGGHFLPVLSSPGTMVLWFQVFTPTTVADALTSPDILVILLAVCCIAVAGGVFIWFIDRYTADSLFPIPFLSGVCTGVYWAIVSMTTVGYGDKVPKSRLARAFTIVFLMIGIMMISLLQSWVIDHVSNNRVFVSQLQRASDVLNGVKVGVVNASLEEWRMRSLGAQVTVYETVEAGMADLTNPDHPLYAFAVDMLAAAVIMNMYGNENVRPSGTIADSITYGFVLNNRTANQPAKLFDTDVRMTLAECMDLLTRAGPIEFSRLVYFRGVDSYLAFKVNEDLRDQAMQEALSNDAMNKTLYLAPVIAVSTVIFAFIVDVLVLRRWRALHRISSYNELTNASKAAADPAGTASGVSAHGINGAKSKSSEHIDKDAIPLEDIEVEPLGPFDDEDDDDHRRLTNGHRESRA